MEAVPSCYVIHPRDRGKAQGILVAVWNPWIPEGSDGDHPKEETEERALVILFAAIPGNSGVMLIALRSRASCIPRSPEAALPAEKLLASLKRRQRSLVNWVRIISLPGSLPPPSRTSARSWSR